MLSPLLYKWLSGDWKEEREHWDACGECLRPFFPLSLSLGFCSPLSTLFVLFWKIGWHYKQPPIIFFPFERCTSLFVFKLFWRIGPCQLFLFHVILVWIWYLHINPWKLFALHRFSLKWGAQDSDLHHTSRKRREFCYWICGTLFLEKPSGNEWSSTTSDWMVDLNLSLVSWKL